MRLVFFLLFSSFFNAFEDQGPRRVSWALLLCFLYHCKARDTRLEPLGIFFYFTFCFFLLFFTSRRIYETHLCVSSVFFFVSFVVLDLEMQLRISSVSFFFFFILFLTSGHIYTSQCAFLLLAPLSNLILRLRWVYFVKPVRLSQSHLFFSLDMSL